MHVSSLECRYISMWNPPIRCAVLANVVQSVCQCGLVMYSSLQMVPLFIKFAGVHQRDMMQKDVPQWVQLNGVKIADWFVGDSVSLTTCQLANVIEIIYNQSYSWPSPSFSFFSSGYSSTTESAKPITSSTYSSGSTCLLYRDCAHRNMGYAFHDRSFGSLRFQAAAWTMSGFSGRVMKSTTSRTLRSSCFRHFWYPVCKCRWRKKLGVSAIFGTCLLQFAANSFWWAEFWLFSAAAGQNHSPGHHHTCLSQHE